MAFRMTHTAALAAALLLGGCSFVDEALFPAVSPTGTATASSPAPVAAQPDVTSSPLATDSSGGASTGTFVGTKVDGLRNDLNRLKSTLSGQNDRLQQIRAQTVQDSERFHGTVAAIEARLQVGTTPGNPILVQQWNEAEGELDRINEDVLGMNRLTSDVANTSGMAAYLLDSIRAARSLSGAVDEDHRQLRILEDDANGTTILIQRLLTELSADSQRQQQYLTNERLNLNTLAVSVKNGQLYGTSLTPIRADIAPVSPFSAASPVSSIDQPLVVIHFDRPNVHYEDALYTAVKGALSRRPGAVFEVVAMTPTAGPPGTAALGETAAVRNAQSVARSLTQMGLPSDRLRLSQASSATASDGEVQVFVR